MIHVTRRSGMETQVSIPRDMSEITEVDDGTGYMPSTRLACTVGPASSDVATLEALLQAGMVVARFDFSYGDGEMHQAVANNLKAACASTGKNCATMLDTRGPEVIVMNRAKGEALELKTGQEVVISCDSNVRTTASTIVVAYPGFADSGLEPGSSVYVGEYLFSGAEQSSAYLTVKQVGESRLLCECNNNCKLSGLQLIAHFVGITNPLPALPASDREVIASFGVANEINVVSLSFARSAADIQECRLFLDSVGLARTQIAAKIENREGLVNYEEIVGAAEAVVLSRGNLGIDLPPEKIFVAQRMVLKACNFAGKPVFATRVCDTMTDVPRPTRAEATDVANLVLDGVDGILLGSETFNGFHPVTAARTVQAICRQAERCYRSDSFYQQLQLQAGAYISNPNMDRTEAIASAAVRAVEKLSASLIVAFTITGRTARYLAKYRPPVPILLFVLEPKTAAAIGAAAQEQGSGAPAALTSHPLPVTDLEAAAASSHHMAQSLLLLRSMVPVAADPAASSMSESALLEYAFFQGEVMGMVKPGDQVVVLQCPRPGTEASMFPERGVLKLVEMADEVPGSAAKRAGSANIMRPTLSADNIRALV